MKRLLTTLFLFLVLALPAQAEELIISAAASLTDAFSDIEPAFEAQNPGVDVIMNFASSGALYRQIEQGAPADVFASANVKWMTKAEEGGFVLDGSRVTFAQNSLVLCVPKGNRAQISALVDLTAERVGKIGIGSPEHVPAGQYAKGALTKAGLWDQLTAKYIFGESVRQILDYVGRAEVDCGFVYMTDAVKAGDAVQIITEVPLEKAVTYPIAALKQSAKPDLAKKFVAFVASPEGQKLLAARGFKSAQ